jgi:hypothetical protein
VLRLRTVPVELLLRKLDLDFSFIAPSLMDWSLSCILGFSTTSFGSVALGLLIWEESNAQIF